MTEQPDLEEIRQRALRAKAVLDEAGWVFDEFIKAERDALMSTAQSDQIKREEHFQMAFAAAQVKGRLRDLAQSYTVAEKLNEHRNANR